LFWFSCQYLPSDWLERLFWGYLSMVKRLFPQSPGWRECFYVSFFILFVYVVFSLALQKHTFYTLRACMIRPICTESAVKHQLTDQSPFTFKKEHGKVYSKWKRFNMTIMITIMVVMWVTEFMQESFLAYKLMFPFWHIFKYPYRYIIIIIWWMKIKVMMHFVF